MSKKKNRFNNVSQNTQPSIEENDISTETADIVDEEIVDENVEEKNEDFPTPTFPPEESAIVEIIEKEEAPTIKDEKEIKVPPVEISKKQEEKIVEIKNIEKVVEKKHDENILINVRIERNGVLSYKGYMKTSDIVSKIKNIKDLSVSVVTQAIANVLLNQLSESDKKRVNIKKK